MGEEEGQVLLKKEGVEEAQGEGHDTGGDSDPEGSQGGAAVALLNVLPAQLEPQLVRFPALHQVGEGAFVGEGVRLRGFPFKSFRKKA